jgi:hypothetical protein
MQHMNNNICIKGLLKYGLPEPWLIDLKKKPKISCKNNDFGWLITLQ